MMLVDRNLSGSEISGEFWDPFEGKTDVPVDEVFNRSANAYLPGWVSKLEPFLLIAGLAGFVIGTIGSFSDDDLWSFAGYGTFGGSVALILLISHLTGSEQKSLQLLKNSADRLGFAARAEIPKARLGEIRSCLKEFFVLKVASAIPLDISTELWGVSKSSKIPLWIGVSLFQAAAVLGGPKNLSHGRQKSAYGKCLMFIVGYQLSRNTGVRVQLFPEIKTPIGPLDIDIQTESVEFNRKYNIRLHSDESQDEAKAMSAQLLQTLTPAFQAKLIDLADRFATRIIIDGKAVFFAGYHILMSDDQAELDTMLTSIITELSEAAVSFKRYAE
ncbi:MAG: hypothetical protein AAGA76_12105 [Pseudomonadota bacterium]